MSNTETYSQALNMLDFLPEAETIEEKLKICAEIARLTKSSVSEGIPQSDYTVKQQAEIVKMMLAYGGSFIISLAKLLQASDRHNRNKILFLWKDTIDEYYMMTRN